MYDTLDDLGRGIYDFHEGTFANTTFGQTFWDPTDWDRYSCDPLNQFMIHMGAREAFGLTPEEIFDIPLDIMFCPP